MKEMWEVFKDGLVSGAASFGALVITIPSFVLFVLVWCIAYAICQIMFVVTELVDYRFGVEDWHPDTHLAGYEPHSWGRAIVDTYNHWVATISSHIKKILK